MPSPRGLESSAVENNRESPAPLSYIFGQGIVQVSSIIVVAKFLFPLLDGIVQPTALYGHCFANPRHISPYSLQLFLCHLLRIEGS